MKQKEASNRAFVYIPLLLFAVIAAVVMFFVNNSAADAVSEVTATISEQYSHELNAQTVSHISATLENYYADLDMAFSLISELDAPDTEKLGRFIGNIKNNTGIAYLAFADTEGYLYDENGGSLGTLKTKMLGRLLNGEKHVVSDNESINGQNLILVGTSYTEPVRVGEKQICIVILGVTPGALSEKIILSNFNSGGYSSLMHADGSYVIKNPSVPYSGLNQFKILEAHNSASQEVIDELKAAVAEGGTYMMEILNNEGEVQDYAYFAPVPGTDWYSVNTMPGAFIKTSVVLLQKKHTQLALIIGGMVAVLAIIIILAQYSSGKKLRKSREELAEALELARAASESKTAFLFNMSHDIRTPMNAILGYTDIGLAHAEDAERTVESFKKIRVAGSHLLNLINDILEMSRIEAGKLELCERETDIIAAIESVDIMSRSLALSKNITYETVLGDICDRYIYADELHVNEIIINLISNAVKYTPAGGKVTYSINQVGEVKNGRATFRFAIADNGIGMSEEFQKHLFEAFSRETNSTVSKTEGAGLGLSIVKKIVDIHGGTVRAESEQNKGSVFTVELPFRVMTAEEAEKLKAAETKPSAQARTGAELRGKRILLVEDNEINREIATEILEDAALLVEEAEDGSIALEKLREKGMQYYDLILMDIQMPVMDGYAATKAIRALPGGDTVKIIALSANAFEEDKQRSKQAGMNAHVAKPININELFRVMGELLP